MTPTAPDVTTDPLILGRRPMFGWERKKVEALRAIAKHYRFRIETVLAAGGSPNGFMLAEASALDWAISVLEETPGDRIISDALRALVNERAHEQRGTDE